MKIWRRNARLRLIAKLGGQCANCGETDTAKLEFNHLIPLTDEQCDFRAQIGANKRMVLYRREAEEGLLDLRCQICNKHYQPTAETISRLQPTTPF